MLGPSKAAKPRRTVSLQKAESRRSWPRRETRRGEVAAIQAPVKRPRKKQKDQVRFSEAGERKVVIRAGREEARARATMVKLRGNLGWPVKHEHNLPASTRPKKLPAPMGSSKRCV